MPAMSKKSGFKRMPEIFSGQSGLGSLVQRAQALAELDRRLQLALPGNLRGQCQLANVRQDTVVLVCQSQIEASKLRMFSRQILQIIRDDFKIPAKKLRIKVAARPRATSP
jgi:hypothetical protein